MANSSTITKYQLGTAILYAAEMSMKMGNTSWHTVGPTIQKLGHDENQFVSDSINSYLMIQIMQKNYKSIFIFDQNWIIQDSKPFSTRIFIYAIICKMTQK